MAPPLWEVIFWEKTMGYLSAQSQFTFFVSPKNVVSFFKLAPPLWKILGTPLADMVYFDSITMSCLSFHTNWQSYDSCMVFMIRCQRLRSNGGGERVEEEHLRECILTSLKPSSSLELNQEQKRRVSENASSWDNFNLAKTWSGINLTIWIIDNCLKRLRSNWVWVGIVIERKKPITKNALSHD